MRQTCDENEITSSCSPTRMSQRHSRIFLHPRTIRQSIKPAPTSKIDTWRDRGIEWMRETERRPNYWTLRATPTCIRSLVYFSSKIRMRPRWRYAHWSALGSAAVLSIMCLENTSTTCGRAPGCWSDAGCVDSLIFICGSSCMRGNGAHRCGFFTRVGWIKNRLKTI